MGQTGQLLQSFLPLQLLARLYGDEGRRPVDVEFEAAVLIVDVSRFTALVEQLSRRGHGGLEEVPRLLSLSYARCAEHVGAHGGEVVCFAGDSLMAYWPADASGLGKAVADALACAQAICNDRPPPGLLASGKEPSLHLGIGAGTFWAAAVGSEGTWNLAAGGEAVSQAGKALSQARSWEYVLCDNASKVLKESNSARVNGPALHNGQSHMNGQPPAGWLGDFLAPGLRDLVMTPLDEADDAPVRERMAALAEIRPVTALFARISGITPQPDALQMHQRLLLELQAITRDHGGPPGELHFDEKGLVFIVAFGARGAFHRDDPHRAVETAQALLAAIRQQGFSASIGIATGDALFQIVGSARRRQMMVLGTPVNRAARLMAAVTGDIVCDAPTERAARTAFSFERRGALQLEGLGDMAAIFRPVQKSTVELTQARPVGRARELQILEQALAETGAGENRLAVILGEPGIGKTTLVNAFVADQSARGVTALVSRAGRDDRRTSLLAWRRVLEALAGQPPDSDAMSVFNDLHALLLHHPALLERLPLLGDVLSLELPQSVATRHLEGAHRADATMRLIGEVIGALAPRPLLIVLEDSQWLDSASWRLLEWLLGSMPALMLVLCMRAGEIPEEMTALQDRSAKALAEPHSRDIARFLRIVEIGELNDASINEIVARTLGGAPPHNHVSRRVAALAAGNPLFAEEITLALKSEGLVAERDGQWRSLRSLDGLNYFEGVERVIRERLDRLDPAAQDVVKAAAVIGRSFGSAALEALHGQVTEAALASLVAARLVHKGMEPGQYEFRHDQIRDVVYSAIPGDLRQKLHSALARWLEANGADDAMLVRHFEAAGDHAKAVEYADAAAVNALQTGSLREVEAFIGICLEHEPARAAWDGEQLVRSVRWRRQLAEARYSRGDIHGQGVAVRNALAVAGAPVPASDISVMSLLIARALRFAWREAGAPQFRPRPESLPLRGEIARCLNQAATVDYFELRSLRAMCNLLGAAVHSEKNASSLDSAVASAQLACGLGLFDWRKLATRLMHRAEQTALALADPTIHSHVATLDALWHLGHCEWQIVDERLDQAQALALKAGDQLRWCNAQGIRFWSLYYRGDQGALEPAALELLSRAQNAGNIQQEIWALRCKALCVLHTDRPREAEDILRLITSALPGSVDLAAQISANGALALALARIGKTGESVEAAVETLAMLRKMRKPASHSIIVGISGVLEVLLRGREAGLSARYEQWPQWERQALADMHNYCKVFELGKAQLGLWSGVSHWLDGRTAEALSLWKQSLQQARQLSLHRDESIIAAEIRRREDRR